MKPHLRIVAGRPVLTSRKEEDERIAKARERFGRPFAHEHGATWRPRETPLLAEWMAGRIKERG